MRTHELADFLKNLSVALSSLPDAELTSIPEMLKESSQKPSVAVVPKGSASTSVSSEDFHRTLATLSKRDIVDLVKGQTCP